MSNRIKQLKICEDYYDKECCMVMIPVSKKGVIVGKEGVLFANNGINKYLEDKRRNRFPYSTIPTHYEKKLFSSEKLYTNQVLEYSNVYSVLENSSVTNYFSFRKGQGAVLSIDKKGIFELDKKSIVVSSSELKSLFKDKDNIIVFDGEVVKDIELPSFKEALESAKEGFNKQLELIPNDSSSIDDDFSFSCYGYYYTNKKLEELNNISDEKISFDAPVIEDFYIAKVIDNGSDMSVDRVHISLDSYDKFRVDYLEVSKNSSYGNEYCANIFDKRNSKIKTMKEPVIDEKLNQKILRKNGNY